jgi:hypothetical protein
MALKYSLLKVKFCCSITFVILNAFTTWQALYTTNT